MHLSEFTGIPGTTFYLHNKHPDKAFEPLNETPNIPSKRWNSSELIRLPPESVDESLGTLFDGIDADELDVDPREYDNLYVILGAASLDNPEFNGSGNPEIRLFGSKPLSVVFSENGEPLKDVASKVYEESEE